MNHQLKLDKILMGICLNEGESIEEISQHLGISSNKDEVQEIVESLSKEGFVQCVSTSYKCTKTDLTPKGHEKASYLFELT
ncbi:MarR family transcriptional regulator [Flammeovirga kamogawensis]|uniref:MarR family transcriptional regulator n=1 Tax=Flammeovirga kamogawensis TaxID=373891 RepID=A0ABX8H347_9BACT|nr:helix-turn-helix domain-containing protein [Flammeovirga kamogawensis]MBB6460319.1 Mn-dependent DtxR family transcriptional regulator [Flammeovirga kamogawensis]QWG10128.1 hypothetical protein KM029_20820 [Flammeovirga kamogawensis]TRX65637.1 hypothetical protein EO216_24255 [Flammeovirga kamogawensis]